jgi:membrane associated rhomboid family serine protease
MTYGIPAQQPAPEVPVCPRHPDRVAYVRCQRCGRPACPECQRPAAVGFQCVDCVREMSRTARGTRTVYGGAVTDGKPKVTIGIMIICAALFVLQWIVPNNAVLQTLAYVPLYTMDVPGVPFEPWRMITAAFLHSQGFILHIAFNMYALWILGQHLEPLLGRSRFIALYLISAFGGSVGVLLLSNPLTPVVGASGAIFGLFGALFVVQRQRGGDVRSLVVLIAINAVIGFIYPNISWQAHLGGLVTGLLAAVVLAYAPQGRNRNLFQAAGLAGIAVLLIIVSVLRSTVPL